MVKSFRVLMAAVALMGIVGLSNGAKAQDVGGVSLLDPTTVPLVGAIVETLLADSGLTGALFSNVLNTDNIPDLPLLSGGAPATGLVSAIPGAGALAPVLFPVLDAVNGLGLPLLDPASLGAAGGASAAGGGGLPLGLLAISPTGVIGIPAPADFPGVVPLVGVLAGLTGGGDTIPAPGLDALLGVLNSTLIPALTGNPAP